MKLTHSEIEGMLEAADEVAREAYGRMSVVDHPWARHTNREVEFVREVCGIREAMEVLDIGCGVGRHAVALALLGHEVVGVDYCPNLIDRARKEARTADVANLQFKLGDCRSLASNSISPRAEPAEPGTAGRRIPAASPTRTGRARLAASPRWSRARTGSA